MEKEVRHKARTKMETYTSEYAMSAGDNADSRKAINASLTSQAIANEHSFRNAMEKGLAEIAKFDRK